MAAADCDAWLDDSITAFQASAQPVSNASASPKPARRIEPVNYKPPERTVQVLSCASTTEGIPATTYHGAWAACTAVPLDTHCGVAGAPVALFWPLDSPTKTMPPPTEGGVHVIWPDDHLSTGALVVYKAVFYPLGCNTPSVAGGVQ
jgi:hypothetical protein